jgi:hypothetical protein
MNAFDGQFLMTNSLPLIVHRVSGRFFAHDPNGRIDAVFGDFEIPINLVSDGSIKPFYKGWLHIEGVGRFEMMVGSVGIEGLRSSVANIGFQSCGTFYPE